jgi:hypothetical protein
MSTIQGKKPKRRKHEDVEGAGNTDSSASGDFAHLTLNQDVCMKEYNYYCIHLDYMLFTSSHQRVQIVSISLLSLILFSFVCEFNFYFHAILLMYILYVNKIKHTARNRVRWLNLVEALCSKME